jgi:hypothetical protein
MLTDKSSEQELIEALRNEAGVDPADGTGRDALLALCRENGIKVGTTRKAKAVEKEDGKPKAYVISVTGDKDKREVIVGVNGVISQIQCDVDVEVKPEIVEVLRNARKAVYTDKRNDIGQVVERVKRFVPSHSFSIKREIY